MLLQPLHTSQVRRTVSAIVDARVDPSYASQRASLTQVYRVCTKERSKMIIVLEKAIATVVPNYFCPEVFSEDPIARVAGEAERPEYSVVVYEISQVLKKFFDVSKSPC